MTYNSVKPLFVLFLSVIVVSLTIAVCSSEEYGIPVESTGVQSQLKDVPSPTDIFQQKGERPLSDLEHKIGIMIEVQGDDDTSWVLQTDATDELRVRIGYQIFETVSSGGDRFVVVNTPMDGPFNWFSHCCWPRNEWSHGIWGDETYTSFNAMQEWISQEVLKLNVKGLPVGTYRFYHAYDLNPNGLVDFESLKFCSAAVRVKNPISVSLTASPLSGKAPLEVDFQVIVNDPYYPDSIVDTCSLIVGDQRAACATYNKLTLMEGTHTAWAEVKDKFGRYVMSDPLTITVSPPAQNQPPTISNLTVTPAAVYSYDESFTIHYDYDDPDGKDDVETHVIGIGVWSQTYPAGGSGQFQRSYHFTEGTTPGDHYIDAYVIDSAGNYSNTLSSSIYFGGGSKPCGTFTEAGSDAAETHYVEMGQTSGWFWFEYETFTQEDRITIYYENNPVPIFDSKCIGTNGTRSAHIKFGPGNSTKIMVHVEPNCFGGSGTRWNFTVRCPTVGPY
ncbi:MAG: hypothetical protein K9N21_01935 [Deltaproteobacteria bacterium]|nr:hypothetical protein [Deltaproteobacteria bacterium]